MRLLTVAMASLELYPHGTQPLIFGVGGVKHKKFKSDAEAQAFCRAHHTTLQQRSSSPPDTIVSTSTFDIVD